MRLAAAMVLLTALAARAGAETTALEQSVPKPVAWRALEAVKADIRAALERGEKPLVVFDIDETLIISDRGLHWDPRMRVLPGAREYVQALLDEGARVVYLTGRKSWFRQRTVAELERLRLPMGQGVRLVMNPTQQRGFVFKGLYRPRILRMGTPIAFFENEKDNTRLFRHQYPDARVFRLNTRARYPDYGRGSRGITVIDDFSRRGLRDDRARLRGQARRR